MGKVLLGYLNLFIFIISTFIYIFQLSFSFPGNHSEFGKLHPKEFEDNDFILKIDAVEKSKPITGSRPFNRTALAKDDQETIEE